MGEVGWFGHVLGAVGIVKHARPISAVTRASVTATEVRRGDI